MATELTAAELGRRIAAREISCVEAAESHLEAIEKLDGQLGCFLTVDREYTLAQARAAQEIVDKGHGGPLTGVPIALKDNMSTEGVETTCGSKILKGYVPPFDGTVPAKLKRAGLPILGKTNLDEFAMGTSTENSAFQLTRNPWDTQRSPGGSSGGSAAAVAAGLSPLSLGSDTGGSIRQPAGLCGIVGFKPTYGRCSRYGLVAFASSLDQIGPFGRTVEDVALISEVITGHDPLDSTSLDHPPIASRELKNGSLKGLRMALPKEMFGGSTHPDVLSAVYAAIETLKGEGVEFSEVSIPSIEVGVTTYYIIAPAEASSNLARFDGVRYGPRAEGKGHIHVTERTRGQGFGHEVKSRIMIGTYALSAGYFDAYYVRAGQVRAVMNAAFNQVFSEFDAVLSPTSPIPAFKLGELTDDPLALKLLDYCTIPANLGGFPGVSLNCGFSSGLPVGLQLLAPAMADERLLQIAYSVEQALPPTGRPPMCV
ncbi:MAG TPA: Asp-tRNA(Asn)/Glu-tRNA(Gln) amidotransferase subunit GatA [Fimbriimonas sp.]|nr:Asp-tRNA(Asn)/Glu-tRNA(Gln) amidotransferase subunit GatA [Fimbriimonas sp.]